VRVLARRESEPEPAIEIRVLSKETFTLGLFSFAGAIIDTESGKDLGMPAIVPPGEHVLRVKRQ
jgi:hypothetical protein